MQEHQADYYRAFDFFKNGFDSNPILNAYKISST